MRGEEKILVWLLGSASLKLGTMMIRRAVPLAMLLMMAGCGDGSDTTIKVDCSPGEVEIVGHRYRAARQCLEREGTTLGCKPAERLCPQLVTYAVDDNERCYRFDNLCLPDNFTRKPCGATSPTTCRDASAATSPE
ncbi:MAG: hypothetical protein ABI629_05920 [bacterium]